MKIRQIWTSSAPPIRGRPSLRPTPERPSPGEEFATPGAPLWSSARPAYGQVTPPEAKPESKEPAVNAPRQNNGSRLEEERTGSVERPAPGLAVVKEPARWPETSLIEKR